MRRLGPRSLAVAFALSGCNGQTDADAALAAPARTAPESATSSARYPDKTGPSGPGAGGQPASGTATLTGVRISEGDAVNCAGIRSDDGVVHPVSGLPGDVAIGTRVTVSGFFGVSVSCIGRVLVITNLERP